MHKLLRRESDGIYANVYNVHSVYRTLFTFTPTEFLQFLAHTVPCMYNSGQEDAVFPV